MNLTNEVLAAMRMKAKIASEYKRDIAAIKRVIRLLKRHNLTPPITSEEG